MDRRDPLLEHLVALGLLPEGFRLPDEHGPTTVHRLAKMGLIEEAPTLKMLSERLGIPYLDLEDPALGAKLDPKRFERDLSSAVLWQHSMAPLYEDDGCVVAAFSNPFDQEGWRTLEFLTNMVPKIVIVEEEKLRRFLTRYFPSPGAAAEMHEGSGSVEVIESSGLDHDVDVSDLETPPVIRLVNSILSEAVRKGASDIHLEPSQHGIDVRFRIDGNLRLTTEVPRELKANVLSRVKLIAGMDIAERRRPQDGRMRIRSGDEAVDLRVSAIPTPYGEKIVLRLLPANSELFAFGQLGMPPAIDEGVRRSLAHLGKMLLVTGPTGSGKTTTLYACLNHLRDGTCNIETVEDPIEYRIPGISQIQVNPLINLTFASALRSVLRQDPDVIMIGEIRDGETARIAAQAAQTGHIVLSTLHTNDAPSAVVRLVDLGVEPYSVASSLGGVLAQRLVRKICKHCSSTMSAEYIDRNQSLLERLGLPGASLRAGAGCQRCFHTGYRGRIGVYSFLEITDEIADLIRRGAPAQELVRKARQRGFEPIDEASVKLVASGTTTLEEIRPYLEPEKVSPSAEIAALATGDE